jgi:hypothetical protein
MPDRGRRPPHLAHTSPGRISCSQRAGSPAIENFLVRRPPAYARRAGALPRGAARPAAELGWLSRSSGRRQRRASRSRLMRCELCARGATASGHPPRSRKSNNSAAFGRAKCDGLVRTSSATPGSHPSQAETQVIPRVSARRMRTKFCVAQPTRRLGWTGRDLGVKRVAVLGDFQADGPWWEPRSAPGAPVGRGRGTWCDIGCGHVGRVGDGSRG